MEWPKSIYGASHFKHITADLLTKICQILYQIIDNPKNLNELGAQMNGFNPTA